MEIVLVGAGRMGLTHLRGLSDLEAHIQVVDPRSAAEMDVRTLAAEDAFRPTVTFRRSLADVTAADAAILAETAGGRLDRFAALLKLGVDRFLLEKPLEQSRERVRHLHELARESGTDVRVDFVFRTLPLYQDARDDGGPFRLTVTGGAFGLACNGVHFIDLGVFLSGGGPGEVVYAHVEEERTESPRGPTFCDYGGEIVCAFRGDSRLSLACSATRGGPVVVVLERQRSTSILDLQGGVAILHTREAGTALPAYRYGAGYTRSELSDPHRLDLPAITRDWALGGSLLPAIAEAIPAHELLFDALETTGEAHFAVT